MKRKMSRSLFVKVVASLSGSVALRGRWFPMTVAHVTYAQLGKTAAVKWVGAIESDSLIVFDCKADFV